MKVNTGHDAQSRQMGGDYVGDSGTSTTAPTATTFTADGKSYAANALKGHIVVRGSTYGVILSNTGTVLTIDKWYNPADPGGAAAATPAAGAFIILPGGAPSWWMALTESSTAPGAGDVTLTGELNNAGGGLNRALCTYSHTLGTNQYQLAKTFTKNASDGGASDTRTPAKAGIFWSASGGELTFSTLIPSPPAMVSTDQLTVTETITV